LSLEADAMTDPHPAMTLLRPERIEQIVDEACETLERVGVRVDNDDGVELLASAGATVSDDRRRVFIPRTLVQTCLQSVPSHFVLRDRSGETETPIGGDHLAFVPGSAAVTIHDFERNRARTPATSDVVDFVRLTDQLAVYDLQSTGVVPADVPEQVADRYRLFLALIFGRKPVITGTFAGDAFATMREMLAVVRGGDDALRAAPLAVFDCCPSPPLCWSDLTCQTLIDCARAGVPAETVSMPLPGAAAPVTLAGSLVQHTAETISGVVIHQTAAPGAPLVYGGAPACFDMRAGTTPLGAIETMLMDIGYVHIARSLGLPTHTYMGLSDAKAPDYQAGMESAMGAALAALAGVNVMAGPGMLDFVNCQSLEKLVLDAETCASVRRLRAGVAFREETAGLDVLVEVAAQKNFLTSAHTRRFFRDEVYYPSAVIDRAAMGDWEKSGATSAVERAHTEVGRILDQPGIAPPDEDTIAALEELMVADARRHGLEQLPDWRSGLE
jgi:trimethylamine--corrinoid protein Co-methyltransferase